MMKQIFAVLILMMSATVWAGDFEDGMAAYDKGDYESALSLFHTAAAKGSTDAQIMLGVMYENGRGVPQSDAEALRWLRLAAEQNDALAQYMLGMMHKNGKGVPQDYAKAHMWWNLASAQGNILPRDLRDQLAKEMTPEQIAEAQKLARECLARNYKNCD